MENLLHILKLIKQTKCENKQNCHPLSNLDTYRHKHTHSNKTHKHTQKCKH